MLKEVEFNKEYEKGNSKLCFNFKGKKLSKGVNYKKVSELLDTCFGRLDNYDNMVKNVTWIRTILKDYDETLLEVLNIEGIPTEDYKNLFVGYENKNLETFGLDKTVNNNGDNEIFYVYYTEKDNKLKKSSLNDNRVQKNLERKAIKLLNDLKVAQGKTLDDDGKMLYEIYKLFYKENPDFSSKDINVKVQVMLSILSSYNVTLNAAYGFRKYSVSEFPYSLYLDVMLKNLNPFGLVETVDNPVILSEEVKNTVKAVGEVVRECICDKDKEVDTLIRISSIFYASKYKLSPLVNAEAISNYVNCSSKEVEDILKKVRKIGH